MDATLRGDGLAEVRTSAALLRPQARRAWRAPLLSPLAVVGTLGAALVVDSVLIGTGRMLYRPEGFAALTAEQVVGFAGAALFWRSYRPRNRISPLLLLAAALTAGQGLQGASS